MSWIRKFLSFLKNNYSELIILVVLVILAFFAVGCQGLANANGDGNQIVISRNMESAINE